ncbi:MAG TPA: HupE/UreJ family protein [Limnobacter sp.]|nr:HupE/UreJ family protein [Limnobacter sp.]
MNKQRPTRNPDTLVWLAQTLLGLLMMLMLGNALAHEMGTSALQLREFSAGQGQLVFKRSQGADGSMAPIDFAFEPACTLTPLGVDTLHDNEVIQTARFECAGPLGQHRLRASGFVRLSPDLIVRADLLDGHTVHGVLTPQRPGMVLNNTELPLPWTSYFNIGVDHLVFGLDHVLFITGLFLLWRKQQGKVAQLVGQLTLFTLGHSITLALVVLGWLVVPTRAIEAWIALSVLYLAVQIALPQRSSATRAHWVLIALFGLLHGSGFALSMADKGFPADALWQALLAFNLGIEAGQLAVVLALLAVFSLFNKLNRNTVPRLAHHTLLLLLGGFALHWTIQRVGTYV